MLSNYFNKLDSFTKLLCVLFIMFIIFIAKSITLIIALSILSLIVFILINQSVNIYINTLKIIKFWLIIIWIAYIMFLGISFNSLIFIYKLILCTLLFVCILQIFNFNDLHFAMYKICSLFKFKKYDYEKISYNLTVNIYFLKYFLYSGDEIKNSQFMCGRNNYNLKRFYFPRILYSTEKVRLLEENLNLKFYKLEYRKINSQSLILIICFVVLIVIAIFKEVIF